MAEIDIDELLRQHAKNEEQAMSSLFEPDIESLPPLTRHGVSAYKAAESLENLLKRGAAKGAQTALRGVDKMLGFLEPLQYPEYAVASAAYETLRGDGQTNPARAAWQGLTGQRDTDWGDVVGLSRDPSKTWGEWAGRDLVRFGLNTALDPLLLLGPFGKAVKARPAVQAAIKALEPARESLAGTKFGKAFYRYAPRTEKGIAAEEAIENARKLRQRMEFETGKLAERGREALEDALREDLINDLIKAERLGTGRKALSAMLFRGLPEDNQKIRILREMWETNDPRLPDSVRQTLSDLHARSRDLREQANIAAQQIGLPEIGLRPEDTLTWVPRPQTPKGERRLRQAPKEKAPLTPEKFASRSIMKALDPETGQPILTKEGLPIVGKFSSETHQGKPIKLGEASLRDIESTIPSLHGAFVADPVSAYVLDANRKARQIAFTNLMKDLRDKGVIYRFSPEEGFNLPGGLPPEMVGSSRMLDIPGLETFGAPKWLANRLENEAGIGPAYSRLGQLFKDYTSNWKRNTLALFPAYHLGNVLSNQQLIYSGAIPDPHAGPLGRVLQGLTYPAQHIRNVADAYRLQRQRPTTVIPGISNEELLHEINMRGGLGAGMYAGELIPDIMQRERPSRTREAIEAIAKAAESRVPGSGDKTLRILEPIARGAEGWGRLNEAGLRVGSYVEDNARLAVMLDYLRKNRFDPLTMSPQQQERMLDDAVRYAKGIMVDYSAATPFEQKYLNNMLIPFWNWNRGITNQAADRILNDPARMARLARFQDLIYEPLSEEEKAVAPSYISRGMPTKAIGPYSFGESDGKPNIMLMQRVTPYGSLGEFVDPRNIFQFINPGIKGLAGAAGIDLERWDKIDPYAERPFAGLYRPLVGDPRYQNTWGNLLWWRVPQTIGYLARTASPLARPTNWLTQRLINTGLADSRLTPLTGAQDFLQAVTGFKYFPYDEERYRDKEQRRVDSLINRAQADLRQAMDFSDDADIERIERMLGMYDEERDRILGY